MNYESHKFKRLIKESLLVTKDKPLLNEQVKLEELFSIQYLVSLTLFYFTLDDL